MMKNSRIDHIFIVLLGTLVLSGLVIFYSASLGLGIREDIEFSRIVFSQVFFGAFLGFIAMWLTSKIPIRFWQQYALHIFIFSFLATFLVFVPGLGFRHGGAQRWIDIFGFSFQPSELLKIASIILFASWIATVKKNIATIKLGLLPLLVVSAVVSIAVLLQRDTGTTAVILCALFGMYLLAGAKWSHFLLPILICIVGLTGLYISRDYVRSRIDVFLDPSIDPQGAGYQLNQSLIAVGSGEWYGKGFGNSIQKYGFLPEPMGDSIFAVFSEEWGFIGATLLVLLFVLLVLRGFKIAIGTNNIFGFSLVSGIMFMIISQTFINISAMTGIIPLTGITLPFVSKGGTSLFILLASMGIVLGASRGKKI